MTDYQTNSNGRVAYAVQAARGGKAATGAASSILRSAGGQGIRLTKASTSSAEIRNDGMSVRGRHGTQKTASAYNAEMSLGSHDPIIEALMRGTWDPVVLAATEADMTSVTTTANTIVAAAGDWLAKGFRVGDIVRATGLPDAANNGRNMRLTGVTANTLTVAETLTANAAPDNAFTIARPGKRIINPAALVKRYFTLEEYEGDIDQSTVLTDFVWGNGKLSMAANGIIRFDPGGVGTGQIEALDAASSPYFTGPVASTGAPMAVVEATIRFGGEDLVELTSLDLTMDIQPAAPDVFGSGAIKYAPDVFTGALQITMNLTMLRKSLAIFSDFIAETPYSLHVLAVDNEAEPKDFLAITVPNFTLGSVDPSEMSRQGGGRTQTINIPPALVGVDMSASGDGSMIKFQTTAA
jgi:hypothetical protein